MNDLIKILIGVVDAQSCEFKIKRFRESTKNTVIINRISILSEGKEVWYCTSYENIGDGEDHQKEIIMQSLVGLATTGLEEWKKINKN